MQWPQTAGGAHRSQAATLPLSIFSIPLQGNLETGRGICFSGILEIFLSQSMQGSRHVMLIPRGM